MVHSKRRSQRDQLPGMAMKHIDSPSAKVQPIGTGAHIDREVRDVLSAADREDHAAPTPHLRLGLM